MRYAVYHDVTLELLGSLDAAEYPERSFGPIKDGRTFLLPMLLLGPARAFDPGEPVTATLARVAFRPLVLRNQSRETFSLFVECHPDDLARVQGFRAV